MAQTVKAKRTSWTAKAWVTYALFFALTVFGHFATYPDRNNYLFTLVAVFFYVVGGFTSQKYYTQLVSVHGNQIIGIAAIVVLLVVILPTLLLIHYDATMAFWSIIEYPLFFMLEGAFVALCCERYVRALGK